MAIYAWVKEKGESCDSAIGCGQKMFSLFASDLEEAREEIGALLRDDYGKKPQQIASIEFFRYVGFADPHMVMVRDGDYEIDDDETCNRRTMEKHRREFS